jgi:hypothetical protein
MIEKKVGRRNLAIDITIAHTDIEMRIETGMMRADTDIDTSGIARAMRMTKSGDIANGEEVLHRQNQQSQPRRTR